MIYPLNATSQSIDVQIVDDNGLPVTGLLAATFPTLTYSLAGANADVAFPALTDLTTITTAYAAGGVKERGAGVYRLDLPNGAFAAPGEVKIRGEAAGKHVIAPWIDVAVTVAGVTGKVTATLNASDVTGDVPANVLQIGSQAVTCAAPVTVGAFVGAAHALAVDASGDVTFNNATIATVVSLTNAPPDTSGTTTLLGRLTAARAGYMDNLNVGGAVASHADIIAINQSASKHLLLATVQQFEPGETYTVEMRTFAAADGSAVNADATPTLTATGNVSGNLSANLSAATNPATGVYRWTYTPGAAPTLEQIRFDGAATIAASVFGLSAYSQTVDFATAVFTATDQAHLASIFNKLPANNIADETLLLAAVGTPQQAGVAVTLPANPPANFLNAAAIAAAALNGKGDWLLASGYTAPDNADIATIKTQTAKLNFDGSNNLLAVLSGAGLDAVLIESGITPGGSLINDAGTQLTAINARQALALLASALAGLLSGAPGTSILIAPTGKGGSPARITATVDASGDRTAITLMVPT